MSAVDLLPCAHCGASRAEASTEPMRPKLWHVFCAECDASGPVRETDVEAIAAWNRRAPVSAGDLDALVREAWEVSHGPEADSLIARMSAAITALRTQQAGQAEAIPFPKLRQRLHDAEAELAALRASAGTPAPTEGNGEVAR